MLLQGFSRQVRFTFQRTFAYTTVRMNAHSTASNSFRLSVDEDEVKKFNDWSDKWWDQNNNLLLSMNTVRVPFIRDGILSLTQRTSTGPYPLEGYKIIDVGCGGGILSESLARLGASVTGIDPGQMSIDIAINHASKDEEIKDRLTYICDTVENIAASNAGMYDAVVCSEVVEHVADVQSFINCCVGITKDDGSLFFTTINRTYLSYVLAILGAEYVLRLIPQGTHDWNKFITPEELKEKLQLLNCRTISHEGYMFNPLTKRFDWSFLKCFYALHAQKSL